MVDVAVICEGKTERLFCEELLKPHLASYGVQLYPIEIGIDFLASGGNVTFSRVLHDMQLLLVDYEKVTTLVDFFRLGNGWSGMSAIVPEMTSDQKACIIEECALKDAVAQVSRVDVASRFIPNVLMHEFEGLLFTDPQKIVEITHARSAYEGLAAVAKGFPSPEDINTGSDSAPSKRLQRLGANYGKIAHGARIAAAIGLVAIRLKCPHFGKWLSVLERLGNYDA